MHLHPHKTSRTDSLYPYTMLFLTIMYAITTDADRVYTVLFGTGLINVSRQLRSKDVDDALVKVAASVEDWSGGTRIGHCLRDFNTNWSRRVPGQGAVVLLITDGDRKSVV